MKNGVLKFVQACDICQRQKYIFVSPGGLLQPHPIPERVWEDLTMDFFIGLLRSKGFKAILVVVDSLTKYNHFVPLMYTARMIVKEIVRLHDIPNLVVSDRYPLFMKSCWRSFSKMQGTTLKMSTTYHPPLDG